MRSSSILFAIVTVALLRLPIGFAQSCIHGTTADLLVEVIATHTTPSSERRYVYLRVFSDGTAEYQSSKPSDPEKKEHATTRKTLTKDEFMRIKSVVDQPKLASVEPKYETRYAIVDSWTEWKIETRRTGQTQTIQVLEFSPGLARTMKHPYPDALVKLGCNVEKMRAELSGETPSLDSECETVLAAKDRPHH